MKKRAVLFVCIHNSARSQMAEAFLRHIDSERFDVESAGLEPGSLNPVVVEAMREVGIDISGHTTQSVDDVMKSGKTFDYVITVCDQASGERCPVFSGETQRLHWNFADPSTMKGSFNDQLVQVRGVREEISHKIQDFCVK